MNPEKKLITHQSPKEYQQGEQERIESRNKRWQEFLAKTEDLESLTPEDFKELSDKFFDTWLRIMPKEKTEEVFSKIAQERTRREEKEN